MLKILLSSIATLSLTSTSFTNISYSFSEKTDVKSIEEFLKEDIENKKIYLGKQNFIEYNERKFTSDNAFKNYLLSNSILESELTSSNPSKIVTDYNSMTLDDDKIYSLDVDNSTPVFRDASGNIAKTSEDALNTYAHLGLIKERYSYDGIDWFTSPEEAKIKQKNNLAIHKSLYYVYNGEYFNAFNSDDISAFLNKFLDGYYIKREKDLSGNPLGKPIIEVGDRRIVDANLRRDLESDFKDHYIYEVSEMETTSKLEIGTMGGDHEFRVYFKNSSHIYKNGEKCVIRFVKPYSSESSMQTDFKNLDKWSSGKEGTPSIGRYYYYRYFDVINPDTGEEESAKLEIVPPWSYGGGENYPNINQYSYTDKTTGILKIYLDSNKNETDFVCSLPDIDKGYNNRIITPDNKTVAFVAWFNKYADQKVVKFSQENKDKLFNYDDVKKGNFIENIDGTLYKDLVYNLNNDKGECSSVITSYLNYISDAKPKILAKEPIKDENGVLRYQTKWNFYASKEQLDNFLYLVGKTFTPVLRYSFGTEEDQKSRDGKLLAKTYQEAKELAFINANPSLKKKYLVYDIKGSHETEGSTPEEALIAIHNKIKLQSKLVNNKEIETWDWDLPISYNEIISDGKYLVYKLKDDATNSYIYFQSEEYAIKAIMSSAKWNGKVNNVYLDRYLYTYFDSKTQKQFSTIFYGNDTNSAIIDILNQINDSSSAFNMLMPSILKQQLQYDQLN